MYYLMNKKQYDLLRSAKSHTGKLPTHEDIVDYVNDNLGLTNIKQDHLVAQDFQTKNTQYIRVDPIRIISNIIIID